MKKVWIVAALMLCIVVLCGVYAFGYLYTKLEINEHFVDVIVQEDYNDNQEYPKEYYTLYKAGWYSATEPFQSDPVQILMAEYGCFDSYIDRSQIGTRVLNRLEYMALTDENGNSVEITPVLEQIFQEVAKLRHTILLMYILQTEEEYYVVVELNVNLHAPCTLYYFDQNTGKLVELVEMNNKRYLGLRTWVE